ncbi:MAG: dipeptide epimerase [Nitrospirales bacterium]|nr:dipeptide epimerase [Nitrospirales bacterium]
MTRVDEFRITKVEAWPVVLPLLEPFIVASGSMTVAHNVFVRIQLQNGAHGFGEMAPFPDISGEDQAGCLVAFPSAARSLLGQSALHWRQLAHELFEGTLKVPAMRCGLETALLDALCRGMGIPLWALWGGADVRIRTTDVTLPIGEIEQIVETARRWFDRGFRVFKMKVGRDVEADIQRVEAVYRSLPAASFVIDANQGFTADQTLLFLDAVHRRRIPVLLLEQPVHRDDWDGLLHVHQQSSIPIAADESVRSLADAERLIRDRAVDVFNVKITKCGVMESVNIVNLARASGLRLMIGGMVESRVAMGCSLSLVLGIGGFDFIDLDMPLLLALDPVVGGYRYEGHELHPWKTPGLGLELPSDSLQTVVIQ